MFTHLVHSSGNDPHLPEASVGAGRGLILLRAPQTVHSIPLHLRSLYSGTESAGGFATTAHRVLCGSRHCSRYHSATTGNGQIDLRLSNACL